MIPKLDLTKGGSEKQDNSKITLFCVMHDVNLGNK